MALKFLIIDPDITFAISIKRALEQGTDYQVTVFGTGGGALDFLRTTPQDGVLIDFNVSDMPVEALVKTVQGIQPGLVIFVSPRSPEQITLVGGLGIQGSIAKPYYARQLLPLIKERIRDKIEQQRLAANMLVSPDFDAAIAALPSLIAEPPISPDDTFRRHLAALLPDKPATTTGLRKALDSVDLSGPTISAGATISDVVSGKPLSDPTEMPAPEPTSPLTPTIAEAALDALDTISIKDFTLDKFTEQVEQTARMSLPDWVRDSSEQTAAFEPAFVKAALESTPLLSPAPEPALDTPEPDTFPDMIDAPGPAATLPAGFDPLAQIAATVLQLSVGSTARATLLTQDEQVIAAAGEMDAETAQGLARVIAGAWRGGEGTGTTLVRYVPIPNLGDFLLFSTLSVRGTKLSMLFPSETPLKAIRKQARQLLDALDKPELNTPRPDESGSTDAGPADDPARTMLSHPTDLRPPDGLHLSAASDAAEDAEPRESRIGQAPFIETDIDIQPVVSLTMYSILLAPRGGVFKPEVYPLVPLWLTEACLENHYQIEAVQAQPTFLSFQIGVPATDAPNQAVRAVMDATERTASTELWADGYYLAASNRAITQQEIAQFLRLQKAG